MEAYDGELHSGTYTNAVEDKIRYKIKNQWEGLVIYLIVTEASIKYNSKLYSYLTILFSKLFPNSLRCNNLQQKV